MIYKNFLLWYALIIISYKGKNFKTILQVKNWKRRSSIDFPKA